MFNWISKVFSAPGKSKPPVADEAETCAMDAAEVHKNRGNLHLTKGEPAEAVACYQEAISIAPDYAEAHNNLGLVFSQQGRIDEALTCFLRAISLKPSLVQAHINRGNALRAQGRLGEALAVFKAALAIHPELPELHNSIGVLLREQGQIADALASFQQAIARKPDYAEAHYNRGCALHDQGNFDLAQSSFKQALAFKADLAEAHLGLGNLYRDINKLVEALMHYDAAVACNPHFADAHLNAGNVRQQQGNIDAAEACYLKALEIQPDNAVTYNNLGLVRQDRGDLDAAGSCFRKALTLDPDYANARFNLALTLLGRGQLTEGWEYYKFRFTRVDGMPKRGFPYPEWAGEPLKGKALLIWGEQGVGDEIMFAGLFAEAIADADHCVIECAPKLLPLFARSFPAAQVVPCSNPPHPATRQAFDFQCAAGDLARWLRPTLESFPSHTGYLTPNSARVAYWQERLAALGPGRKVGICWRSSLASGARHLHYTKLDQWGPIFSVPGVHFVNLQYDECDAELAAARQRFGIPLHAFAEVDLFNDLDEAAALTQALDLAISAPTAAGALAAALNVPTWMMSYGDSWDAHGRPDHPWFPALSLYPRRWNQSWDEIITAIAQRLWGGASPKANTASAP